MGSATTVRYIFLLLFMILSLQATDVRLSNPLLIDTNSQRVSACQTNCHAGVEILYDKAGANGCTQIWGAGLDGKNKICLSCTSFAVANLPQKNQGNAVYSPDGNWVVFSAQAATSNFACSATGGNPGAGLDNDIYVCDYQFASSCTKLTSTVPNTATGVLQPQWTSDQALMIWMNITNIGGTAIGIQGTFRSAAFTTPGGVPTLGVPVDDTPNGTPNWYEPAGSKPLENPSSTVYFTSGALIGTTRVYSFNVLTHSGMIPLTPFGVYSEFYKVDQSTSLALLVSSQYTPQVPPAFITDLVVASSANGQGAVPLTTFNTPGTVDYLGSSTFTVGKPSWSSKADKVFFTLGTAGAVVGNKIYRYDYRSPKSSVIGPTGLRNRVGIR